MNAGWIGMVRGQIVHGIVAMGLCVGIVACSDAPPNESKTAAPAAAPAATPPAAAPAAVAAEQRYDMKGKVVAVDKATKKLTVDHGDIPGFMMAMTMPYPVKDEKQLEQVTVGDNITAKVVSSGTEYWLDEVKVVKDAPKP